MLHLLVAQHYTVISPKSPVIFKLLFDQGCKEPGRYLHCYLAMLLENYEILMRNKHMEFNHFSEKGRNIYKNVI